MTYWTEIARLVGTRNLNTEQSGVEPEPPTEISLLLQGWRNGDREALDALLPRVYKELRRLAHFQLQKERCDHTLQSAGLVNEAYLRLIGLNAPQWESRTHFLPLPPSSCVRSL